MLDSDAALRSAILAHRRIADDLEDFASGATPHTTALIENWSRVRVTAFALQGFSYGHPRFDDGRAIFTSQLIYADIDSGWARTYSRWYRLGSKDQAKSYDHTG